MDNRNLSQKEREALEETKKALEQRTSLKKGSSKVIRETEDGGEVNDQGFTQHEMQIVRQERKKRIVNHMLCTTFHQVNEKGFNNTVMKNCCERLMLSAPNDF